MHTTLFTFNFKSSDLAAEEKNYLDYHVALARVLPGLRLYLTGKLRETGRVKPDRYRAALLACGDAQAWAAAMRTDNAAKLSADGQAHITDARVDTADAEWVVRLDSKKPQQPCFMMVALFNFKPPEPDKAEQHYTGYHVGLARRLPGLRGYLIGKTVAAGNAKPDRYRMAVLIHDSYEAMVAAYRSPVGQELRKDEEYLIGDPRVCYVDARVEVLG